MYLAGVSDKAAGVQSAWVGAGEVVLRRGEQKNHGSICMERPVKFCLHALR